MGACICKVIDRQYHGAAGESVEHVKEHKAGEGHGSVPRSDHLILHLKNMVEVNLENLHHAVVAGIYEL